MNWFALHAAPRQERKVAGFLQREAGVEVFAPRIRFRRMRAGRPIWANEALFPGYLFARFDYFAQRRQIQAFPGVASIVHFGDRPAALEETLIAELRTLVAADETIEIAADPQPGSDVIITGGPLRGLKVLVTRVIPGRQRIAILLELLGNDREVEIETARVLPVNPRRPR